MTLNAIEMQQMFTTFSDVTGTKKKKWKIVHWESASDLCKFYLSPQIN